MPSSVNTKSILAKVLAAEKTKLAALRQVQEKFDRAKSELLTEFETSPVTQEIDQGPELTTSSVLPGGYGNLYSFLGFIAGSNPTGPVRQLLNNIRLVKKPTMGEDAWVFRINIPDKADFDDASPMTWEAGRSWIDAVTHGLGTFSHYMFSLTNNRFTRSKSGTAVQVSTNLRGTAAYFTGVGYVIGMLGRFKRKMVS